MKSLVCFLSLLFLSAAVFAGPVVEMKTSHGTIEIELNDVKAPGTVKNFLQYVSDKFYDGLIFHRVINGFMIQGGGMTPDMKEKLNRAPIQNEASNGLSNEIGTIAMARTPDPHSATSQFFINVENNTSLNHTGQTSQGWGYAVFGKVISGMHVVNRIKMVKTGNRAGHANVPMDNVVIQTVRLKTAKKK